MWFVRVNMTDRSYSISDVPENYRLLGGRGLTSSIIADEVPPLAHPLGPNNKLAFCPGIVTGTPAATSARVSVGGKSPLTGGIKEANGGSEFAQALAKLQVKALIVEGQPQEKGAYWGIRLDWDAAAGKPTVAFFDATEHKGQDLYQTFTEVYQRYGDKISLAAPGISGELGYGNSGIAFNDMCNNPTRFAGRGGLGAVMASKGLKLIITDPTGAPKVQIADQETFDRGRKALVKALASHDITKPKGGLNTYGTAVLVNILNEAGGLPTRNFSSGRFEDAASIAGEAIFETNQQRMGKDIYNHNCSPGCTVQCSNTLHDEDGNEVASCIEYESDWALGANLGIGNLDDIGAMVQMCNALGLDTIETGVTLGVAMEAGVLPFGDAQGAINLIKEMGQGTAMGRILGSGTGPAGRTLGVTRIPAVKNQGMPAYEPRAVKGIGITYATSPMGADHTAGYTIAPEILGVSGKTDPLSSEGKAAVSEAFQATTAFIDTSGHCLFIAFAILDIPEGFQGMCDEVGGIIGKKLTGDDVLAIGRSVLKKERAFNAAAGLGNESDRLPEFMSYEPLPPHNVTFDVSDEVLDSVYANL